MFISSRTCGDSSLKLAKECESDRFVSLVYNSRDDRHSSREENNVTTLTSREQEEIDRVNSSGLQPVVFVHGLWLLSSSWECWRELFEQRGYATLAPGWPDDPETVQQAKGKPDVFANKKVKQVADHYVYVIHQLKATPAVVGHSYGGMIAQRLAGEGISAVTVAIDPAPFRCVLALPRSSIKAAWPVLKNPLNYRRAVTLTYDQFRYAFASAVDGSEARRLFETFAVPAPGAPVFQGATANLNPWTEVRVDTRNPKRGPLLIISGQKDNTVPWAIANASHKIQAKNPSVTKIREIENRGHSLTIDSGWREVAEVALAFIAQHTPKSPSPPAV
jgi:pimeloyl-ACP methyl ester carboxylesterase